MTGVEQPLGHATAHRAKPDEAEDVGHGPEGPEPRDRSGMPEALLMARV
jgi:hypothetical protein